MDFNRLKSVDDTFCPGCWIRISDCERSVDSTSPGDSTIPKRLVPLDHHIRRCRCGRRKFVLPATGQIRTLVCDAISPFKVGCRETNEPRWLMASGHVTSTSKRMITPAGKWTKPAVTIPSLLRYLLAAGQSLCVRRNKPPARLTRRSV